MKTYRIKASIQRLFILFTLIAMLFAAFASPYPAQAASLYVLDQFSAAAYNNNHGTVSWSTDWTETNDSGGATSGDVQITGGELRLGNSDGGSFESVQRGLDLSTAFRATLSYQYRTTNLDSGAGADTMVIEIYNGASWTTLETVTGNASGTVQRAYPISAHMNAGTVLRFRITNGFTVADEYIFFDNVRIDYTTPSTHTGGTWSVGQIYYVPIPEDQGLTALQAIANSTTSVTSPMFVYVAITIVTDGSVIIFDHWEDSYEANINTPVQDASEVWGDGNDNNGRPPGFASDLLNAGDVIILNNTVNTSALGVIDFDGGDKIASTEAIAVTRTSWPSGAGTLLGGSVEMLDTSIWGASYEMPVDNTVTTNQMFEYHGLAVMAAGDGTQIYNDSVYVTTLNQGQSYLFNNTLSRGATITASAPIQAQLLIGDIGSTYEGSYFTLYPIDHLSSSYFAPVSTRTANPTAVFLNNPNSSPIDILWETTAGAQTPVNVPAGGTAYVTLADGTGAHFYTTDGSIFQAISAVDFASAPSGGQSNDWGYTLIPENQLTQQAQVGWGPGQDPTITPATENGSPVWVMPAGVSGLDFNICVDYNGDGLGSLTDSNGGLYDALLTLDTLERSAVYDPDRDQTGMKLYVCNASIATGVNIAVAWGQNPATASTGAPGLDVGTSVPPLPNFTGAKGAQLTGDANGDGLYDVGETFTYRIRINNTGPIPIPANTITVADIVPQYTLYVPNSAYLDSAPIPDNLSPATEFPLDEGGYVIHQPLAIGAYFIVSFQVYINANTSTAASIRNNATVDGLNLSYTPQVDVIVQPPDANTRLGDRIWVDLDGDGQQDPGEPGLPGVTVELDNGACSLGSNCPTAVTDVNGEYFFPNLPDGPYTVVVNPTTLPPGYTQTGDPDQPGAACTTCDSQHSLILTSANRPFLTADFGYNGPTLAVNKTSNPTGNVFPGDTIQYTIVVENLTGGIQNNIAVSDPLPAGLTFTPGSTQISLPVSSMPTVGDAFNSQAFTGGQDSNGAAVPTWLPGGWIEVNEGDGPTAGDIQVLSDVSNYQLRLQDNDNTGEGVRRDVDLSGCSAAALSLTYRRVGLDDANDFARLKIGKNGALTDNLNDFAGPTNDASYQTYNQDITRWISAQTRIQLLTSSTMGDTDSVFFDDVLITCTLRTPTTNPGGAPPDLAPASAGYSLWPGEQMTIVFTATVDDPVADGTVGYTNTVSVVSSMQPTPIQDTVANPLPPAAVGDLLWLDLNSNGAQDPGEPGVPNVTVWLYRDNGDGSYGPGDTLVQTTTTNSAGQYTFDNLSPDAYFVVVDETDPDLAGLTQTFEKNDATPDNVTKIHVAPGALDQINEIACTSCDMQVDFGYLSLGSNTLDGAVFFDINQNGLYEPAGTPPETTTFAGVTINLWSCGLDGDCNTAADNYLVGSTVTDANGVYTFANLPDGVYSVAIDASAPSINLLTLTSASPQTVSLDPTHATPGPVAVTNDFGLYAYMDCGDLPDAYDYHTTLNQDGPCHVSPATPGPSVYLGSAWDNDNNGQGLSGLATGDDAAGNDDEDGVEPIDFINWHLGGVRQISVFVTGQNAYLAGWFDWNDDLDFTDGSGGYDPGEYINFGLVAPGPNTLDLTVPTCATTCFSDDSFDTLFARFRLFNSGTLPERITHTGLAEDGEVEDYRWANAPTAVDVADFSAAYRPLRIVIHWETALELDTLGFHILRSTSLEGVRTQINPAMILSQAPGGFGASYDFVDYDIQPGVTYYYWLAFVETSGDPTPPYGPIQARAESVLFIPLVSK